ncbi:MAG TPA: 23S rRNA (adenine(2503)-C(2))-methyltransferase RlmN, partial [Chloroflexota bacterium]|nr:23S rRNA (adenine(2503)-C(2))-methyltransferase RlmN [Chloroflexota bacterium]
PSSSPACGGVTTNPVLAPVRHPEPSEGSVLRPITDLSLAELRSVVTELGQPPFRADQIAGWVYRSTISSFEEMTNVPKPLRAALAERFRFLALEQKAALLSTDGETRKLALQLPDGEIVESVLMRYPQRTDGTGSERATVCVSTQVGCPVKCAFCATGLMGFSRNLSSGEILDQALHFLRWTRDHPPIVRNVVFMGMGEPLLNYENTMAAVDRLVDPVCAGLGVHRMTVSTSGWLPGIARLTEDPLAVRLAVSLHAPNDALRTQLVPLNKRFPIPDLMAALHEYQAKTGRRVTFEYTLLDGVNDTPDLARQLVALLRGLDSHVNLIPMNPVQDIPFAPSPWPVVDEFHAILRAAGIICTVRREMGRDIKAACGQLYADLQRTRKIA